MMTFREVVETTGDFADDMSRVPEGTVGEF